MASKYFTVDNLPTFTDDPILETVEKVVPGFTKFMAQYSGVSFNDGLYRIHAVDQLRRITAMCIEAFPAYENRIICYSSNWMGHLFAIDPSDNNGKGSIVLFDSDGAGDFDIPFTFAEFQDKILFDDREELLQESLYEKWKKSGGESPTNEQCVGFEVPLMIGGEIELSNMQLSNMAAYWSINTQIYAQVKDLPPGTALGEFTIED